MLVQSYAYVRFGCPDILKKLLANTFASSMLTGLADFVIEWIEYTLHLPSLAFPATVGPLADLLALQMRRR